MSMRARKTDDFETDKPTGLKGKHSNTMNNMFDNKN